MSSPSSSSRTIILKSSDGVTFEVDVSVASQAQTIKHIIEDIQNDTTIIPVPNVTSKILSKVIVFCEKHAPSSSADGGKDDSNTTKVIDDELKTWDADFLNVDQSTLFGLVSAANYLDIKSLLNLTCKAVAEMIMGKTPEQIREIFNIKNDFTPEEEEEVRRENAWAFQ